MPLYNATNVTDMVSLYQYTQTLAPFGELALIAIFVVTFISLKRYEVGNAFPAAAFATMISAILLNLLGLLSQAWSTGAAVLFGVSVVILWFRKD